MSTLAWSRIRTASFADARLPFIAACVALVAFLAVVPLAFLLWASFHATPVGTESPPFTLANYVQAYGDRGALSLIGNSLLFAAGTAVFAFAIGATLAWMNERTNTPFKGMLYSLAIVPLIVPGVVFTIAWILLASPKIGLINLVLQRLFATDHVFVNVYSMAGMIWVDGLHYSPVAFLFMSAAFRSMDPSLEESALMSGASAWQVAWRVTLRLTWPAVFSALLILFVRSIESFEVPALLGLPVGIQVFTSSIYDAVHQYPSQVGLASSYATLLLAIAGVGIYAQSRVTRRGSKYATVTGKGFRPRTMDLGPWRWATASLALVYFALVGLLPFLVLLWSSLQKYYSVPSMQALREMSFDTYRTVLADSTFREAAWNSVLLGIGSATVVMLLTSVICWTVVKTKLPGRWLLDQLAAIPLALPGLVLGLALMVFYLNCAPAVYGTIWILLIAYVTRFMPYGMRYNTTALLQIHKELEESAQMSGAGWGTIFWRIVLPLLRPGLFAGWLFVVIVSMRELSSSILLYSPGTEVVSTVVWEKWEAGEFVELSALGVIFVVALLCLATLARSIGRRFGVQVH